MHLEPVNDARAPGQPSGHRLTLLTTSCTPPLPALSICSLLRLPSSDDLDFYTGDDAINQKQYSVNYPVRHGQASPHTLPIPRR